MRHIGTYWTARIFGSSQKSSSSSDPEGQKAPRFRQRLKDGGIGLGIGLAQGALLGLGITYGLPGFLIGMGTEVVAVGGYLIWRLQKQQRQIMQIQGILDQALRHMLEASPYALIPGPPDPQGSFQLDAPVTYAQEGEPGTLPPPGFGRYLDQK